MTWELLFSSEYALTRLIFQQALAFIYLIGFLIALLQGPALIGDNGLLPASLYLKRVPFWYSPSLFHYRYTDGLLRASCCLGITLSLFALSGFSQGLGLGVSIFCWTLLWVLYLSIVNIGQEFYGFGWESLLLEAGFIAIFLGDNSSPVFIPLIWFYRWLLFRLMFGAGLIKIRGDSCWRDYTCMYYHYESQPMPGPTSRFFHHLPKWFHRLSVFINHFVELFVVFFYFVPGPLGVVAGLVTIGFQLLIMAGGNFSWLNAITLVLCIPCFNDTFLSSIGLSRLPASDAPSLAWFIFSLAVFGFLVYRSYYPFLNLFSKQQAMNRSFDRFHLVNTYGAFGTVTRNRPEIIFQGTLDAEVTPQTHWLEYEFKGKPGNPMRRSPQVTPYHYKLDWQLWFAAMSDYRYNTWVLNIIAKMLKADPQFLGLIRYDPFEGKRPRYVRAELYMYTYTKPGEKGWWNRRRMHSYVPHMSLNDQAFRNFIREEGWEKEKVSEEKARE